MSFLVQSYITSLFCENFARLYIAADMITCTKSHEASIGTRSANAANAEHFGEHVFPSTNDDNTWRDKCWPR